MKVTRSNWTENTESRLRGSCGFYAESVKSEVERGVSHLYHLESENADLWTVVRFEKFPEGDEMVVVCVGGKGMREVGKFLIAQAEKLGIKSIRYHTTNPAVHRMYRFYGFDGKEVERVYKIEIGGRDGQ